MPDARPLTEPEDPDAALDRIFRRSAASMPRSPADIDQAGPRVAAIIAEEPLRYRDLIRAMTTMARMFQAKLVIDDGMPEAKARAEADRLFDAIMAALDEDASMALLDDTALFDDT
jgi:hypothetical protein